MSNSDDTLLSDFLQVLGVPHTVGYSDGRFLAMPFKSLFGLSKLLTEYGVDNETLRLADKDEISALQPPFLAHTGRGFVIVTDMDADRVGYLTQGVAETMPLPDFKEAWSGVVMLAYPATDSVEPGYRGHATIELANRAKRSERASCRERV